MNTAFVVIKINKRNVSILNFFKPNFYDFEEEGTNFYSALWRFVEDHINSTVVPVPVTTDFKKCRFFQEVFNNGFWANSTRFLLIGKVRDTNQTQTFRLFKSTVEILRLWYVYLFKICRLVVKNQETFSSVAILSTHFSIIFWVRVTVLDRRSPSSKPR